MESFNLVVLTFCLLPILLYLLLMMVWLRTWIHANRAGAKINFLNLMGMSFRKVPFKFIVDVYIKATQAGLAITTEQLEAHFLAGGHVEDVVDAMIRAKSRDLDIPFESFAKTDLEGFALEHVDLEELATTQTE